MPVEEKLAADMILGYAEVGRFAPILDAVAST
jgi:hypothetical protein